MSEHRSFIRRYVFSTDHKVIGIQYILTGLAMAAIGGLLAAVYSRRSSACRSAPATWRFLS